MRIVVDSSSLFYGFQIDGGNEYITTTSALEEVRGKRMKKSIEMRIELLKTFDPADNTVREVKRVARQTGDADQLSDTDIGLIALSKDTESTLLTNDLAIQNVCKRIGVRYQSFGGKSISTEIEWGYRCIGCRRTFDRLLKECPYCGNEMKRYPKKRRPISGST